MQYRQLVSGALLVIALTSVAIAKPRKVTLADWIARGDAAMEAHEPGRAFADYLHALDMSGDKPADMAAKLHDSFIGWLETELETRRAKIPADRPIDVIRVVDAIYELVKKVGENQDDIGHIAVGDEAARVLWKAYLATVPSGTTPWDELGYVRGLAYRVPSYLPVSAEIKADIETRTAAIRATTQGLLDRTPPANLGARLSHEMVLAALDGAKLDRDDVRATLARRLSLDASVTIAPGAGCAQIAEGVAKAHAAAPKGGTRKVVIKVAAGGTCAPSETVVSTTRTLKETVHRRVPHEASTSQKQTCIRTPVRYGCIETPGHPCAYRESCYSNPDKVETTYEDREETVTKEEPIKRHAIKVQIRAPYTLQVDGKSTSGTLDVEVSASEDWPDDGSVPRWSETPDGLLRNRGPADVATRLALHLSLASRHLQEDLQAAGIAKASRGDLDGAADDLMTSLAAAPIDVPPGFEPLAARAGLPYKTWRDMVKGSGRELPYTEPEYGHPVELTVAEPDADLLRQENEYGVVEHRDAVEHAEEVSRIVDDMVGRSVIGLGLAQWHANAGDGDNAWGLELLYGNQRSYGYRKFWSRELAVSAGVHSSFAASLEGLFRLGAGVRGPLVGVSVHGVGGVSRRGESGDFDMGLPFGLDAGAGGRLTLGPGHARRFEVIGEQLWRLGADAGAVDTRLRFELRYVHADSTEESVGSGVRGWCAFENASGMTAHRTCTLAGYLSY